MKLATIIDGIAADLNDPDSVTWTRGQLARWFNEGRCTAYVLSPGSFAQPKVYKLDPGTEQELCGCDTLHSVVGLTDAQGLIVNPMVQASPTVAAKWTKPACVRYPVGARSFSFDPDTGSRFSIRPPVLPGEDVYVQVVCYGKPEDFDEDSDVPDCAVTSAAVQWVLFRAFMVDSEVASSMATAQVHCKLFFDLLKLKYTRERAMQLATTPESSTQRTMATSLGL